jgi:heme A synthase
LLVAGQFGDAFNPFRLITLDSAVQVQRGDSLGLMSMAHRLCALLTAAYLAWMVRQLKSQSGLSTTVLALSLFSISQVALGVSMIWLELPLALLTLHNTLAAGLLLATINLLHRLTPATRSQPLR